MNPASLFPPPTTTISRTALSGAPPPRVEPESHHSDGGAVQRVASISQRMRNAQAVMTSSSAGTNERRSSAAARLIGGNRLTPSQTIAVPGSASDDTGPSIANSPTGTSPSALFRSRFPFLPAHRRRSSQGPGAGQRHLLQCSSSAAAMTPAYTSDPHPEPEAAPKKKGGLTSRPGRPAAPAASQAQAPQPSSGIVRPAPQPKAPSPTERHNSVSGGIATDLHELHLVPNESNAFKPSSRRHASLNPQEMRQFTQPAGTSTQPPPASPPRRRSSVSLAATSQAVARAKSRLGRDLASRSLPAQGESALSSPWRATSPDSSTSAPYHSEVKVTYDFVRPDELNRVYMLENESRAPDDLLPLQQFQYRLSRAPFLFVGAYVPAALARRPLLRDKENTSGEDLSGGKTSPRPPMSRPALASVASSSNAGKRVLVGYVCATASTAFTLNAIKVHDDGPDARTVCIHSVVVQEAFRGRGIGRGLVERLLTWVKEAELGKGKQVARATERGTTQVAGTSLSTDVVIRRRGLEVAAVLSHPDTNPFFLKCGFHLVGLSYIQTGTEDEWYELRRDIVPPDMMAPWDPLWADEDAKVLEPQFLHHLQAHEALRGYREQQQQPQHLSISTTTDMSAPEPGDVFLSPVGDGFATSPASSTHPPLQKGTFTSPSSDAIASSESSESVASPSGAERAPLPPSRRPTGGAPLQSRKASSSASGLLSAAPAPAQAPAPAPAPATPKPVTQTWAAVYGNALASKTFAEDVHQALEARLVDRTLGTNLPAIYCPRSECNTQLMAPDRALYALRQCGPLAAPEAAQGCAKPVPTSPSMPAELRSTNAPALTMLAFWVTPTVLSLSGIALSDEVAWKCGPAEGAETEVELPIKYLTCAACGCGPLGYTFLPDGEGEAQEYLVAADRVRYNLPDE